MYSQPVLLDHESGHRRIFAQVAYPIVRTLQVVPVVYTEVLDLAAWFPVIWQRTQAGWRAVVLRSLLADGAGQPLGSPRVQSSLPLVLRAYPFVADRASGEALWMDDVVADEPTDIGSSILNERGFATRGTEQRLHASRLFQQAEPGTSRITAYLAGVDAFKPWPLELEIAGHSVEVRDLFVVDPALIESREMVRFTREFGIAGARFISAHAISLYRAAALFSRARHALSGV